jgi:transcription initiation factor IIE alpha subunit
MLRVEAYVLDTLMRDLVGHDRRPASFLVYLWLVGEEQRRKSAVSISYSELAENIGISKSSAQSAIGWLLRRKLVSVRKENVTAKPAYTTQTPWKIDYRKTPR